MSPAQLLPVRQWGLGAGLFGVVGLFWVYRILLTGNEGDLPISDLFLYYLPSYEILYGSLLDGKLPLWNPYQICGIPQLASLQAGFFYPGHLLHLLLPVELSFAVSSILHLALVAISTLALVRRLGFGVGAAVAAALFLAIRGRYPWMIFFPNMLEAAAWLPLGGVAVVDIVRVPAPRPVALLALCTGCSLLAGYPQVSVYAIYSWGALFAGLMLFEHGNPRIWARATALFGLALAIGFAVAAVQLLPAWELTAEGTRAAGPLTRAEQFPLGWHGPGLKAAFLPTINTPFPELFLSLGWVALAGLAIACIARQRRGLALASLGMAGLVLVFAMGPVTPLFDWISQLPAIGWFRFPRRSLFVMDFFVAIAFAAGVQAAIHFAADRTSQRSWAVSDWVIWIPALLLIVEIFSAKPNQASLGSALEAMKLYDRQSEIYDRVAASGERAWIRSPSVKSRQPPKLATYRHMKSISDYEPLNQRRQAEYFTYLAEGRLSPKVAGRPYSGRLKHLSEPTYPGALAERGHLLDVAAVHWLVLQRVATKRGEIARYVEEQGLVEEPLGDPDFALYQNPTALPRAYVVYDLRPAPEPLELMEIMSDRSFDPLLRSYVEGAPGERVVRMRGRPASIVVDEDTRVELDAELDQDGMLVLSDSFYPGWRATVDGEEQEIHAVNHLFRGVMLPAGRHHVVFEYRPWTLRVGGGISSVAVLALLALGLGGRRADELPVSGRSDSIPADVDHGETGER